MYPSALVAISTLSVWSLGAAAAPLPYARSLAVRSPGMMAVDNDIQARMVDDILEEREGEGEGEGEGLPVDAASSAYEQTPPKPKPHHHHYTIDSLNTYLSNHRHHHRHHGSNHTVTAPTNPAVDSAQVADGHPPAGAEPAAEAALATNAPPATEALPAPAADAAPPVDAPPVMRRAFFWDDLEDLD